MREENKFVFFFQDIFLPKMRRSIFMIKYVFFFEIFSITNVEKMIFTIKLLSWNNKILIILKIFLKKLFQRLPLCPLVRLWRVGDGDATPDAGHRLLPRSTDLLSTARLVAIGKQFRNNGFLLNFRFLISYHVEQFSCGHRNWP